MCYTKHIMLRTLILNILLHGGFYVYVIEGQITVTVTASSNPAKNGSEETLLCEFTRGSSIDLFFMAFAKGDETSVIGGSFIASYYDGDENVVRNNSYGEPGDYIMSKPDFEALQGSSTLTIASIALNDIGTYWCSLSDGVLSDDTFVTIDVFVPPSSVEISTSSATSDTGDLAEVIEGKTYTFNCKTIGVRPEAIFQWILENVEQTANDPFNQPNGDDNRLYDSTSSLILEPSFGMNKHRLSCSASVQADPSTTGDGHVFLDVKVPPRNNSVYISDSSRRYIDGSSVSVNENETHMLACEVEGTIPAATFAWEINPKLQENEFEISPPLSPTPSDTLVDSSQTLTLLKPHRSHHKAKVQCNASIDVVESPPPVTKSVTMLVNGPPDKPILGSKDNLIEGTPEVFNCMATNAFPEGGIEWYNGNENITETAAANELDDTDDRYDISSTVNFTPNRRDNGNTIKCNVTHETLTTSDEKSDSKMIEVQFCAENISISESCPRRIIEGQTSVLTCTSTSSNPETDLVWKKGETPVANPPAPIHGNGEYGGKTTTLTYSSQFVRGDNGIDLTCCGTIDSLSCNSCSTCTLNVVYPPVKPTISKNPTNAVPVGETVTLTCVSEGNNPIPTFTWMKTDSSQIPGSTHTLTLSDITRDQAGYYSCVADNGISPPAESEAEVVIVHYTPEITNREDDRVSADEGSDAVLICISQGNPEPNINWYDQNGIIITNDRSRYSIEETQLEEHEIDGITKKSALTIRGVIPNEDYGTYLCNASNYVGQNNMLVSLIGLSIPDSPKYVTILKDSSTTESLVVEWERGHNGGLTQWFIVTYQTENDEPVAEYSNTTEIVDVDMYTVVLENLTPGSKYEIGVYSGNKIGSNKDMQIAYGITIPESPSDMDVVMIFNMKDGTLTVSGLNEANKALTCLQLQLRILANGTWIDWTCLLEDVQSKHVPQADRYDDIRGAFCVEDVCGQPSPGEVKRTPSEGSSDAGLIVGTVFGVLILTVAVIGIAIYLLKKSRNDQPIKKSSQRHYQENEPVYEGETVMMFARAKEKPNNGIGNPSYSTANSDEHHYGNVSIKQFTFPRENLLIVKELGRGEFGRVLLATTKGLEGGKGEIKVAVKTLKDTAGPEAKEQLRKELEVMKILMCTLEKQSNPNIVRLLGSCMEKDPMYVILEYMSKGNLKSQLRKSRTDGYNTYGNVYPGSTFSPTQLITFAREVSNGMAFVAEQKCVHRDLAARNILLNEQLVCKVSDFGLARDVMGSEVYQRLSEVRLPVRWMAYESIVGDKHTIESDVWSFGVLLWEIVTIGCRPYPRLSGSEIRQLLKTGYRMPKPNHCSEQLYKIMLECWEKEPQNRPTFVQIIERLDEILRSEAGYLSLKDLDIKLYEDVSIPTDNEKV